MSDSPRTDEQECEIVPSANPDYDGPYKWVESSFARKLERELNEARALLIQRQDELIERNNELLMARAQLAEAERELAALKHDIERHLHITTSQATQITELQTALAQERK